MLTTTQTALAMAVAALAGAALAWWLGRAARGGSSRRRYEFGRLVDSLSDGVAVLDEAGTVRAWNGAAERIFGYTADEMIGGPVTPLLTEETRELFDRHMRQLQEHGSSEFVDVATEAELVRKNGTTFPAEVTIALWHDDGRILWGAISRDVTERRQAEMERNRLALAVEQANEAIVITDPDGRIEYVNPAFERTSGYRREEAIGRNPSLLKSGRQDGAFYRELWETIRRGEVWSGTFVNRRRDGTLYDETGTISPVRDADGRIVHFVAVKRDVTWEKVLERKLRLKQTAIDHAVDAVFWVAPDAQILDVNATACKRLGYSRGELLGLRVTDINPDATPHGWNGIWQRLRSEGTVTLEARHRAKDGRVIPVEINSNHVSFEGQEYACAFAHDLTQRKRDEAERVRYGLELERRNKELDAFAYVASHDLKAPLRAIGNLASWIREDSEERLTGDSRRHLETLTQRVRRMERLLDDLLQYSRAGRESGEAEDVDTAVLANEVAELVAPPMPFRVHVSPDLPEIRTLRAPLRQVLLNLITNAVKHHDRPDGTITVSAADAGELVEFTVSDDGPGIPGEFQERVFGMFQTLKPRDEVEGSGMGLAIIRKVVELQGGRISLESEGRGCTFRFTWPRTPAGEPAETAALAGTS